MAGERDKRPNSRSASRRLTTETRQSAKVRLVRWVCQNLSVKKEAGPDKNNGADRLHPEQREIAPPATGAWRRRRVGGERVIWPRYARGVIADDAMRPEAMSYVGLKYFT